MRRHACLLVLALLGVSGCYLPPGDVTPEQQRALERESRWLFIESVHGRVFRLAQPAVLLQWRLRPALLADFGTLELVPRTLEDFQADRATWERSGVTLVEKGTEVIPEEVAFMSRYRDGGDAIDLSLYGTFVRIYGRIHNGAHQGKRVELLGLIEVSETLEKEFLEEPTLTAFTSPIYATTYPIGYRVRPGLLTLVE
jgi:hypothetical protein